MTTLDARIRSRVGFGIACVLLSACAAARVPRYDLDDIHALNAPVCPFAVAVAPFAYMDPGSRTIEEHAPIDISEMLAAHLGRAGLFAGVDSVGSEYSGAALERLLDLRARGYQALLVGVIGGYSQEPITRSRRPDGVQRYLDATNGAVSSFFPLIGFTNVIIELSTLPETVSYGGYVQLVDVQLIDTSSGRVLWRGSASGTAGDARPATRRATADKALKAAVNALVAQLQVHEWAAASTF